MKEIERKVKGGGERIIEERLNEKMNRKKEIEMRID